MSLDHNLAFKCLDEVEVELLNIGTEKCNSLHDDTQLSAVIFLLLRATSLLRSILDLLERGQLDSYDAVRRAYLESWLLAYEFRLEGSQPKAAKWHVKEAGSWSADIGKVAQYTRSQGITAPTLGKDYGGLSEVAHPTRAAAENSVAMIAARHGGGFSQDSLHTAISKFEETDLPELLYRFLWLILDESQGMIRIGPDDTKLPNALAYARQYQQIAYRLTVPNEPMS